MCAESEQAPGQEYSAANAGVTMKDNRAINDAKVRSRINCITNMRIETLGKLESSDIGAFCVIEFLQRPISDYCLFTQNPIPGPSVLPLAVKPR